MTKYFAPVAPLAIHRQLADKKVLGPYNLLIASEITKNPPLYSQFWQNRPEAPVELFVDNGVIELGYPMPMNELVEAVVAVGATTIILPDTIDDSKMTIKQVRFAVNQWKAQVVAGVKTLGVVQGVTLAECIACAKSHAEAGVDMLAIPRGLTPNLGSRYDVTKAIGEECGLPMHLLGFSRNIADDIESVFASPLALGLDAATPVWLGMSGRKGNLPAKPPRSDSGERRPSWFWNAERQYGDSLAVIVDNIKRIGEWLSAREQQQQYLGTVQLDAGIALT